MSIENLMRHTVSVYRPIIEQDTISQTITGFALIYSCMPAFIQPASAAIAYFYLERGTTVTHTIYSSAVENVLIREDICVDIYGNQFHLTANPISGLQSFIYLQLVAEQYPEGAKVRLDVPLP